MGDEVTLCRHYRVDVGEYDVLVRPDGMCPVCVREEIRTLTEEP